MENWMTARCTTSLGLSRLIVLTTDDTASASERLINSLAPYIEVVTIGSTTLGKPYTSYGRTYCGKTLNAMQTESVNAAGVSVAGCIAADCATTDDLANNFGTDEGMLKSALDYLSDGSCSTPPLIASRSAAKPRLRFHENALFDNMSE